MKVAIVHDDLVQWGGAERVLLGISELFPEAPIYTSVFDKNNLRLKQNFANKKIITSFLQNIPGWKNFYKTLLPFYPLAFEQFNFSDFDLVISQTTRFAKCIITGPKTIHLCYCHTPPRFLWNFSGESVSSWLLPFLSYLRIYDRVCAQRVDLFLAGSENAKNRIKKVYQREANVLLPFVDLEKYQDVEGFDGGYYLVIARLNSYKRVDLAVKVCSQTKRKLKVVGLGPELKNLWQNAGENIEFIGSVSEELLINLIIGCKGLVVTAEEDFGLTPLEAQALGKGVIAYGEGGARETVVENVTGIFFDSQIEESLEEAINRFEKLKIDPEDCKNQAAKFSKEIFQKRLLELVTSSRNMLP